MTDSCHKMFTDFWNFAANLSYLSGSTGKRIIDPLGVAVRIWKLASLVWLLLLLLEKIWDSQLLSSVQDLEEFPAAQDFDLMQHVGNNRGFWSSLVEQEWYWYSNSGFGYVYQYCKKHLFQIMEVLADH